MENTEDLGFLSWLYENYEPDETIEGCWYNLKTGHTNTFEFIKKKYYKLKSKTK